MRLKAGKLRTEWLMINTRCPDVLSNVVLSICHVTQNLRPYVSYRELTITGHAQEAVNATAALAVANYRSMCQYSLRMFVQPEYDDIRV